jgi:peroxiredoxin
VEAPHLADLYRRYRDKDVEALVINVRESKARTARWAKALGYTFPVLLDLKGDVATAWAPPDALPDLPRDQVPIASNIIVDREGRVAFYSLLDTRTFDARLVTLSARLDQLLSAE